MPQPMPKTGGFFAALLFMLVPALAQAQSAVVPPSIKERSPVEYPEAALGSRVAGDEVLAVTVRADGTVGAVEVLSSLGVEFDNAAREAVQRWLFEPALRDGKAASARIRVDLHFDPPPPPPETEILPPEKPPAGPAAPAPTPKVSHPTAPESAAPTPPPSEVADFTVHGRLRPPSRGASDFNVHVGDLALVPRKNAAELLSLAPGILLTNEGGDGHPEQIFLRGFDARLGQDIEFSVDGVPINQVGNPEGNGYADLNFVIPELVDELRVVEGPFDPRQGNFAVAGSADYRLGLERRGFTAKFQSGTFGTRRALLMYGPQKEAVGTFGGVDLQESAGFGQNRASKRARAMGQYEGALGRTGSFRLTGTAYAVDYQTAGVLREDDYRAGRKGFFDTYDPWQGGESQRLSVAAEVKKVHDHGTFENLLYVIRNGVRSRHNFTGYLLDTQQEFQSPHQQRGDRIDRTTDSTTLGSRGFGRFSAEALGHPQGLELGYAARGDFVDAQQFRVQSSNDVPYSRDLDLYSRVANLSLYADVDLRPLPWLTWRGGVRGEAFFYDLEDRCAATSIRYPSSGFVGDASCHSQQPLGEYRDPTQRINASSMGYFPRSTLLFGPFSGLQFSVAWGRGARAIDPMFVNSGSGTPFAELSGWEGGATYARTLPVAALVARSVFFRTEVSQDFIFSQTDGRNTLAGRTSRTGWVGALRATGSWFDANANLTLVRALFEDTGLPIPYVPEAVFRGDAAIHHDLPWSFQGSPIQGALALGNTYVAPRALPYGQRGEALVTLDGSILFTWKGIETGFLASNLFNTKYRLGEYNYASNFLSQPAPTLVPERHFSAGAPRTILWTIALTLGGDR